ncbi:hypothetical protein BU14_0022s0047 [Porphyra umbilicalis]|uniref:Uncharacterized protein n=1 Tax=Porphyra umbilicalis TaxID=2786 RepID=A0A1X6PKE2_PORUM|nr:hypothetical protein BU14_0022s0047 [Porphyra umbilicalis]|eukprot:OSX81327.1 hypothetical protein BU14_0022s0047 [Porphyra umbilicalis]
MRAPTAMVPLFLPGLNIPCIDQVRLATVCLSTWTSCCSFFCVSSH